MNTPSYFTLDDFDFTRNMIHWHEFFLLVCYLILFIFIGLVIRDRYYANHKAKAYFMPAMLLKIFGGVLIALIYSYYYNGGDTTAYFNDARLLNKVLWHEPFKALHIFLNNGKDFPEDMYFYYTNFRFIRFNDTLLVVKIAAFLQWFTFNSFLVTSALFGFLSFFCIWRLYIKFCEISPRLYKHMAFATLFVPSMIIWGSGIFKDTICISLLSLSFVELYNLTKERRIRISGFITLAISAITIMTIKAYIFLIFTLAFAIYFVFTYIRTVNNPLLKVIATPLISLIGLVGVYYAFEQVGEANELYSAENILETAETTASYLSYISNRDQSSGYDLGEVNYTPLGMLQSLPKGINVTLFRPYPWEANKAIMLFSALESFAMLLLTIYVFFKRGIVTVFRKIASSNLIIFFLVFSLAFSFAVGISTFNFGTLVRYKIPALPFYLGALFLILGRPSSKVKS